MSGNKFTRESKTIRASDVVRNRRIKKLNGYRGKYEN